LGARSTTAGWLSEEVGDGRIDLKNPLPDKLAVLLLTRVFNFLVLWGQFKIQKTRMDPGSVWFKGQLSSSHKLNIYWCNAAYTYFPWDYPPGRRYIGNEADSEREGSIYLLYTLLFLPLSFSPDPETQLEVPNDPFDMDSEDSEE
jgi:hypothetical protein